MQNYHSVEQLAEMVRILTEAQIENWLREGAGSWHWWVLVVLLIAPWFIWAKLVDKKKLLELAFFGMIIMVYSITLDAWVKVGDVSFSESWGRFFFDNLRDIISNTEPSHILSSCF